MLTKQGLILPVSVLICMLTMIIVFQCIFCMLTMIIVFKCIFFKLIFFTAGIRTADEITMVRPTNIWHIYKVNGVIYDGEFVSM